MHGHVTLPLCKIAWLIMHSFDQGSIGLVKELDAASKKWALSN